MPVYSEKVMQHFMNPHNVGEIENADGVGIMISATLSPFTMTLYKLLSWRRAPS